MRKETIALIIFTALTTFAILIFALSLLIVSKDKQLEHLQEQVETYELYYESKLDTYDYYLLVVISRQRLSQDTFIYVLHEAGKPETSDNITHISDQLWSVGEFVIAIEIDEKGSVYYTDVYATISMIVGQYQEQVEMYELYYELKLDYYEERYGIDLDDTPEDFERFLYENYHELYDYLGGEEE